MKDYVEMELNIYLLRVEDIIMGSAEMGGNGDVTENPSASDDNEMPFVPF